MRPRALRLALAGASLLLLSTSGLTLAAGGVDATSGADLQVSGSASSGSPTTGMPYSYTFKIKNSGPGTADGAALTDRLPDGVTFRDANVNGFSPACSLDAGVVTCALGPLPGGTGSTVVITVVAPAAPASVTDTASVASDVADPNTGNNGATVSVSVKAGPVDTIKVTKCYTNATADSFGQMLIKAASSDASARLFAYRPDGSLIGEVQNGGGSRYGGTVMPWQPYDPANVTIRSTSGGSITVPTTPFQP